MDYNYDIVIVGGGPSGLAAAIYGGRARLKTLVIEKGNYGGRSYLTREIVNYPGVPDTSGPELASIMKKQAEGFGAEFVTDQIREFSLYGEIKSLRSRKNVYNARAVILSLGTLPRVLGIEGEKELTGKGVAYCATCDAEFFKNQKVFILGSGDQAVEEGMFIARFAKEVVIISIWEEGMLDCNKVAREKAFRTKNISFIYNSTIERILGEDEVSGVVLKNVKDGSLQEYECNGVFMFVGMIPNTEALKSYDFLNEKGWIITNDRMETGIDGVYAAGDVREKYLRQVSTSVSDGAIAATAAEKYIANLNHQLSE